MYRKLPLSLVLCLALALPLTGAMPAERTSTAFSTRVRLDVTASTPIHQRVKSLFERELNALPGVKLTGEDPNLVMRVTVIQQPGDSQVTVAAVILTAINNKKLMDLFTTRCSQSTSQELVDLLDQTSANLTVYRTTWLQSSRLDDLDGVAAKLVSQFNTEYVSELREAHRVRESYRQPRGTTR
ncbi:MAG TPA: hypothetical protein VF173_38000 [Thermoanaerobaculia bacterium]|nr:hypothetical protein [Thermoanaerobaculia bacterium]